MPPPIPVSAAPALNAIEPDSISPAPVENNNEPLEPLLEIPVLIATFPELPNVLSAVVTFIFPLPPVLVPAPLETNRLPP